MKEINKVEIIKKMENQIGLIIEYYSNMYNVERVTEIVKQIQQIYDYKEPTVYELRPLLKNLYKYVVKNEYHSDLLQQIIKELDKIQ